MIRSTQRSAMALASTGLMASLLLTACSDSGSNGSSSDGGQGASDKRAAVAMAKLPPRSAGEDASQMSVATSAALFSSSPAAVLLAGSEEDDVALASSAGVALGIPVLVTGSAGLQDEIKRLGATTFVTYGDAEGGWDQFAKSDARLAGPRNADEFTQVLGVDATPSSVSEQDLLAKVAALDPQEDAVALTASAKATPAPSGTSSPGPDPGSGELPKLKRPQDRSPALVLADSSDEHSVPAIATARAAGAEVVPMDVADPRANAESVAAVKEAEDTTVLALGSGFGSSEVFAENIATARTAPQLPGGGQIALPGKLYVALYGNVITADLGLLGEQGADASIARAKEYAAKYADMSKVPVIPTFEIIVTVASGSAGRDGSYSTKGDVADIEPWVKKAQDEGVYVILDLQSGRDDSLTQAKTYEKLLKYPNVGLAVDPEWRLEPNERPLQQIGHIDAEEINRTQDWLADLVKTHNLPQKIFTLHQFKTYSLPDRSTINFSTRPEVATLLHADGQGTQAQKQDTWGVLKQDLPKGSFLGWKNFIDEDKPMLTPAETMKQVKPTPNFISYQ